MYYLFNNFVSIRKMDMSVVVVIECQFVFEN